MLASGLATVAAVFVLGIAAQVGAVARGELGIDRGIAVGRVDRLIDLAWVLTAPATPEITGIAAVIVLPLLMLLMRRRAAALRAMCSLGGALALALVAKVVLREPRPPAALWAFPADSGASYPSGHSTVAAAIVVALLVITPNRAARTAIVIIGTVYAVAVAASRVYVANHYPLDVLGSLLCTAAAGLIVTGLSALPAVARRLAKLDRPGTFRSVARPG